MYDEDTIIRVNDQTKSKKDKISSNNIGTDLPIPDTRESCVLSPNPSSNYNDSSYDATHVATLVKENIDLTKQTNTIAQAILLNMPINKSTDSNENIKTKRINNKELKNEEIGENVFNSSELDDKFTQDLKNSLSTIKVNISEMNNNYYGSEFVNNDPMQLKLPLKEVIDNKSVHSLFSNVSNFESRKELVNTVHNEKELVKPKEKDYVNNQRRPSMQSTKSNQSNFEFHTSQEDMYDEDEELKYNGPLEYDRFTIKSGTITFEKVETNENLKNPSITIKYPTKFAETYCKKEVENKPQNMNSRETCNENSNYQEEDEGYVSKHSSKYSSSQTNNSNLTSFSSVTTNMTVSTAAFTVIHLSEKCKKKPIHIFHLDNEGWVCTSEFVDAFTNLKDHRVMLKLLQILEYNVNFKNLLRENYPDLFSQLDKSVLKVPRNEHKKIVEDFVLILMPLKAMLQVLVKLDFLDSKMLKEAIAMMKQSRENIEHVLYELYNNRILYDALNLLFQYKQFKRSIRLG